MTLVTLAVLSTVNVPCGTALSAEQLAAKILDPESADSYDPSAFSFFSDVEEELQHSFLRKWPSIWPQRQPWPRSTPLVMTYRLRRRRSASSALQPVGRSFCPNAENNRPSQLKIHVVV